MSKKIYRTRRKHRSNKRSVKRTNGKIHKRTKKKTRRNNERISRKILYGKNQHGGTFQYYKDLAGSKFEQAGTMISSKLKGIEGKVEEKTENATKSLESLKEKYERWDEVELTWDNNNSYDINFDLNTGILRGKAYLRYGGGRWKFKLFPNRFKLEENGNVLYINIPPGGVDLAKNDEENDISLTRKITIIFTGQMANDNKQNLMDSLYKFRMGLVHYGQPRLYRRNILPRSSSLASSSYLASSSLSLQLPLVGADSRSSVTPQSGLIFRANSQHPSNTPSGTSGTPITPVPQSVKVEGLPIVRFGNSGNNCYRNAVYSVFLNNAFIRRKIMKLKEATDGDEFNRNAYNNFITCLKNIALGEAENGGLHRYEEGAFQINTAMRDYIASYVSSTGKNDWDWFLYAGGGFSSEEQQDSGEFLGYFSRVFSLLGIKVCEYEQITATMKSEQMPQEFWNNDALEWLRVLSPSTYQVELFNDTHKPHELGIDPKTGKRKSIFTFCREIFIRNQITYGIDTTVIASPLVTAPNFVCLNDNRYEHVNIWGTGIFKGWKNMENYKIQSVIQVPIYVINDNELEFRDRDYNCCGVIFHLGNSPNSGHYVSCVKINEHWYYFNDGYLPQILDIGKVEELFTDTFQPPVKSVSRGDRFTIVTVIYELDRSSEP